MLSVRKQKAQLCVNGWIRENYINHDNIPLELYKLCFELYFLSMDSWSKTKSDSDYKFQDGLASFDAKRTFLNAFGEFILSKGDVMEWKFEIGGKLPAPIFIGIIESEHASSSLAHYFGHPLLKEKAGFAYYCYHTSLYGRETNYNRNLYKRQYISPLELRDDIKKNHNQIIMTLDMTGNEALLSYKTGNKEIEFIDHGVAYKMDVTKKYCLAVAIHSDKQSLQIVPC